jgi:hypothetical protein
MRWDAIVKGLVNAIDGRKERTISLADDILECSSVGLRGSKEQYCRKRLLI